MDAPALPAAFVLHGNYPNPFNPETAIGFELGQPAKVRLEVFDLLGQHLRTLVEGERGAGAHRAIWDGRDEIGAPVASGVYFYRLQAGARAQVRSMVLLK